MKKDSIKKLAILLIVFGILVNFIPVASYYLGTYVHVTSRGALRKGSTFEFCSGVGTFYDKKTKEPFALGFVLNLTYDGPKDYVVTYNVYKLKGSRWKVNPNTRPDSRFYGSDGVEFIEHGKKILSSNDGLVHLVFSGLVSSSCNLSTFHTFPNRFYGFPRVFECNHNGTVGMYTRFQDGKVLLLQTYTSNMTLINSLLSLTNVSVNETGGEVMGLFLSGGNTIPPQDWAGWLKYGFGVSFPLNVGFVIIGMLMLIVASRRV